MAPLAVSLASPACIAMESGRCRSLIIVATALCFMVVVLCMEVPLQRYPPERSTIVFRLVTDSSPPPEQQQQQQGGGKKQIRLLVCTMLTDDFRNYAAGAAKIAAAVHRDMPKLRAHLNVWVETALLEMQERPIPSRIWRDLRDAGWQRKVTRPRIAPRNEGMEHSKRFADQFTKLHLWTMEQYDWVLYLDSDVFIVRSLVPLMEDVLGGGGGGGGGGAGSSSAPATKIWAVRDYPPSHDNFNMGIFAIRPSMQEYGSLMSKLRGSGWHQKQMMVFDEGSAEQGFLNAAYQGNWTELAATNGMNLASWSSVDWREGWTANATHIQLIHFTAVKPWDGICPWTEYAPLCWLFWNMDSLKFHETTATAAVGASFQ